MTFPYMKEYAELMNATWTIRKRRCEMEIHQCVAVWTMRPQPELRFNKIFHVFITAFLIFGPSAKPYILIS